MTSAAEPTTTVRPLSHLPMSFCPHCGVVDPGGFLPGEQGRGGRPVVEPKGTSSQRSV